MRKHPVETVLGALRAGARIERDNRTYVMEDGRVWMVGFRVGMGDEVRLNPCFELNQFLAWCEAIPEDELFLIGANGALNEMRKSRAPHPGEGETKP